MSNDTILDIRIGSYAIKRDAGFQCEGCGKGDQLLAVDVPSEDRGGCFCEPCIPDKRTHRIRAGQWNEAADRAEEAKGKAA